MRVHPLAPVVGIDIDGTLGDYHTHFTWFLNHIYFPQAYPKYWADWSSAQGEFSEALFMNKEVYRQAKLAYRMGGLKRCMPLFDEDRNEAGGAIRNEIQYIRSQGIQVWICTTRPWLSLTTVDPDTQYWLERNAGQVDGLIYGEDKYADLIDIVGKDRILGVCDDLPENITRAQDLGLNAAIRWGDHNAQWRKSNNPPCDGFSRVKDMSSIIDDWFEKHNG